MKLSEWAKQQGLSYKTAWRMWKLGQLPIPVEQLPTGTVIVHPPLTASEGGAALYARVSSVEEKSDLDWQIGGVPPVHEDALIACIHSGPDVSQGESF